MRKKIMTLMMGALLLLTACGQTGSNSASTMLPVAAVQSAAQAIAPMEDKMQAGMDSIADAGFHCNVCIVEDGASLLIYVLYAG